MMMGEGGEGGLYCFLCGQRNTFFILSHCYIAAVQDVLVYSSETSKKPPKEINELFSSHLKKDQKHIYH